ncbi:hypothetical protein PMAYCL1PPCAC_19747, partial [Pristionchus mayeri]
VKMLLDLSRLVHSLSISWNVPHATNPDVNYFLNAEDVDWARVILEMFSRKINKLKIETLAYPGYLSRQNADSLGQKVPLLDKKIWFETTSSAHLDGISYKNNEHSIQVSGHVMSIKHSTR